MEQAITEGDNNKAKKLEGKEQRLKREKAKLVRQFPSIANFALPTEAVQESIENVSPKVVTALKKNDLAAALEQMSNTATSNYLRILSKRLVSPVTGTKVKVVKNLKLNGKPVSGSFDATTNTISLDSVTGINYHTVLHEVGHALGQSNLVNNPTSAFSVQMNKLYNEVKDLLGSAYGAQGGVQEFFAEGMSNESFRKDLNKLHIKGEPKSVLQYFQEITQNLINRIFGRDTYKSKTALSEFNELLDTVLSPDPDGRGAERLSAEADLEGVEQSLGVMGSIWKQLRKNPLSTGERNKLADDSRQFLEDVPNATGNLMLSLRGLQAVADISKKYFGELGESLYRAVKEQRGAMQLSDENVDIVVNSLANIEKKFGKEEYDRLSKVIYSEEYGATIYQIDPTLDDNQGLLRYGGSKAQYARWKRVKKEFNNLEGETQRVYKQMRGLYRRQYLKLRDILYDRIAATAGKKEADKIKSKVFDKIFSKNLLDVYFPLAREGRYKVKYFTKPTSKRAKKDVYNMEMVGTLAEANDLVKELEADSDVIRVEKPIDSKVDAGSLSDRVPPIGFVNDILTALDKGLAPKKGETETPEQRKMRTQVKEQVVNTFVETLPETSVARSLSKRKQIAGYKEDPMIALRTKAYDLGRQAVRLESSKNILGIENKIIEAYKAKEDTLDRSLTGKSLTQIYQELLLRAEFARNPPPDMIAQTINQGAFVYTIGFNASSAIVNLSQVPLFVLPYLGGKYGYRKTVPAMLKAAQTVTRSFKDLDVGLDNFYSRDFEGNYTLDPDKVKDMSAEDKKMFKNMEALVELATREGALTKSFLIDTLGLQKESFKTGRERTGSSPRKVLDKITGISAAMFNVAERYNRQTTMVMSYQLALDKISGGKKDYKFTKEELNAAAREALDDTVDTNGGSFLETSPRLSQQGIGRVALMYKNYGLQMYYTMIKSGYKAMGKAELSSDPEENKRLRKEGIKQLLGFHGSALFFAGVQGLPLYGAVSMIANAYLDDDEDDFDKIVRDYIGEGWYKGVVNQLTGADVATRIRLTGLLIQDNRYNTKPSPEEFIGFYLGGPRTQHR